MTRIVLLVVGITGLIFTAWLDDPENYSHDALLPLPTTTVARPTVATGAVVVAQLPASQATVTTTTAAPSTTHVQAVPSTSVVTVLDHARCPEWWPFAAIYFDEDELPTVDRIMWNESRCLPDVIGDGSYGLMQIQWSVWGDPINAHGFTHDDLLDPSVNIMWGYLIAHDAERIGWCTWQPWHGFSGDYGCDR